MEGLTPKQGGILFLGAHAPLEIAHVCRSVRNLLLRSLKQHHKLEITGYGPVWSSMVPYGPIWSPMVPDGPLWSCMVTYGPI